MSHYAVSKYGLLLIYLYGNNRQYVSSGHVVFILKSKGQRDKKGFGGDGLFIMSSPLCHIPLGMPSYILPQTYFQCATSSNFVDPPLTTAYHAAQDD